MRRIGRLSVLACGVGFLFACAVGSPSPGNLTPGVCGIQVSADADFPIATLSGSARLVGHPDDQIIDTGFRAGGSRSITVDCAARCVVVQGSGRQPVTGRTVRFEGVADLRPGEFVPLRMTRKSGNANANAVARRRGCVTGL